MDCSMPGLPVHHQLLEFTQTHVHRVSDAIQPSHPLSSPSLPAPNPLFQKNIYFCFIDYAKAFDCVDHNKLWKILKGWAYQTTRPASWETYMQVRKQQLELDMEQQTGSK